MRRDRSRGKSSEDCPMARGPRGLVLGPLFVLHIWTVYTSLRAFWRKKRSIRGESESRTPGEGFHMTETKAIAIAHDCDE